MQTFLTLAIIEIGLFYSYDRNKGIRLLVFLM